MRTRLTRPALRRAFATAALLAAAAPATAAARDDLCVGTRPGCFATVQAALDAARDGDTISIRPGTFAGGVVIDKSITIEGSGARATVIRGGGPVVTIGTFDAAVEPTVTIEGVTITGGVTAGSPFPGAERRAPTAVGSSSRPARTAMAPRSRSPTASSATIASHRPRARRSGHHARANRASSPPRRVAVRALRTAHASQDARRGRTARPRSGLPDASSEAIGGGIAASGTLTLVDSTITATARPARRRTAASPRAPASGAPARRRRSPAANFSQHGRASSALPHEVEQHALGAAIEVTDANSTTTFDGVRIDGDHRLFARTNTVGDATAFAGGPHVFGTLVMRDSPRHEQPHRRYDPSRLARRRDRDVRRRHRNRRQRDRHGIALRRQQRRGDEPEQRRQRRRGHRPGTLRRRVRDDQQQPLFATTRSSRMRARARRPSRAPASRRSAS